MYSLCVLGTDHLSLFTASSSKLPKPTAAGLDCTVCTYVRRSLCMLVAWLWLPTLHSSIHCHADTTVCMFVCPFNPHQKGAWDQYVQLPLYLVQQNISSKRLRCFVKLKNKALPLLITRIQQRNTCH